MALMGCEWLRSENLCAVELVEHAPPRDNFLVPLGPPGSPIVPRAIEASQPPQAYP